ncbi:MAG: hypothetical protein V4568_14345 [Pseudomonadota bacterium]
MRTPWPLLPVKNSTELVRNVLLAGDRSTHFDERQRVVSTVTGSCPWLAFAVSSN